MTDQPGKGGNNRRIAALVATYEQEGLAVFLDQDAFLELIKFYLNKEKSKTALAIAQHASSHYPYSSDFYLHQAHIYLQNNQYTLALDILEQALSFAPADFELTLLRAEAFIYLNREEEALASLAPVKLEVQNKELCDVYIVEALAYEYLDDFKHMFYALKAALHANPKSIAVFSKIGLSMDAARKHEEASVLFRWVIDQYPYSSLAWYYLGHAQAYLAHNEEAIEAYEYAFLTDAHFEDAYFNCADLCFEMHHFERALDIYKEIGNRFGTDSDLLERIGRCYHHQSLHETARKYLEQAARLDPHNDEVFYHLGECYAAQEKWAKAAEFFRKAIRMDAEREEYYLALSETAFELGRFDVAENAYRMALELAPDNIQAWLNFAWFLLEMMRAQEALSILEEANELLIDTELNYSYIACLFAANKRQEAIQKLTIALNEDYMGYSWLFEWVPRLRSDKEVNAIIALYAPDE